MRILFLISFAILLFSCNQSSSSIENEKADEKLGGEKAVFVSAESGRRSYNFSGGTPVAKEDRIKRQKSEYAKVFGRIHGKIANRVKFTPKKSGETKKGAKRIPIRKDSTFKGKIAVAEQGEFFVMNYNRKDYEVFLTPGDSLSIDFYTEGDESPVVYKGIGAGHNNYLLNRVTYDFDLSMNKRDLYQLDYKDFSDSLAFKRDILLKHLKHVSSVTADFTGQFEKKEEKTLYLDWALEHMNYKALTKKYAPTDAEERIAGFNYNFLKELNMEDPALVEIHEFQKLIGKYFDARVDPQIEEKIPGNPAWSEIAVARSTMKYEKVDEFFKHESIRDYLRSKIVNHLIREDGSPSINKLVLRFRKEVENEKYLKELQENLDKYVYVDDGAIAPNLIIEDLAGKEITLSDFKGKYLYIDVWASWCGPCHHEIPYFQRLKEEYKGENIEFISISLDRSKAPWQKFLYDWEMYKNQYYVNGVGDSDLSGKFKIQGLPQFILIDPEGQIVDLSAPRPSGSIRNDLALLGLRR